ncbi:hypothetical protein A2U01_0088917, partial [Trifolium medium]|nr:hypothetical protein [Trifolium medium]
ESKLGRKHIIYLLLLRGSPWLIRNMVSGCVEAERSEKEVFDDYGLGLKKHG